MRHIIYWDTCVRWVLTAVLLVGCSLSRAQHNVVLSPRIASLQVVAGQDWLSMPVAELDGDTPIHISFDDLTHEYTRYAYRLQHCEADWTISDELFPSDYCEGFSEGNTIDDITESINTNVIYTHYHLQIPNDRCRVKISGNYLLTVYDENTSEVVLKACFMIVDPSASVRMEATTNTDTDINGSHQQVAFSLDYGNLKVINPQKEVMTVIMQNGIWSSAIYNPKPQYVKANGMVWDHNRQLIFNAGNEYRKFETLDVTHTTMGLESVGWDGKDFHAYVWPDEPRPNYIYDEDANGAFYIRNSDNIENDYASQYVQVHFRLVSPHLPVPVFLNGVWTNEQFGGDYEMRYDPQQGCYERTLLLKQGYYSYRYVTLDAQGRPQPLPSEGNFYQTENTYQCLVYYRGSGQRTDLLVGYQQVRIN